MKTSLFEEMTINFFFIVMDYRFCEKINEELKHDNKKGTREKIGWRKSINDSRDINPSLFMVGVQMQLVSFTDS